MICKSLKFSELFRYCLTWCSILARLGVVHSVWMQIVYVCRFSLTENTSMIVNKIKQLTAWKSMTPYQKNTLAFRIQRTHGLLVVYVVLTSGIFVKTVAIVSFWLMTNVISFSWDIPYNDAYSNIRLPSLPFHYGQIHGLIFMVCAEWYWSLSCLWTVVIIM